MAESREPRWEESRRSPRSLPARERASGACERVRERERESETAGGRGGGNVARALRKLFLFRDILCAARTSIRLFRRPRVPRGSGSHDPPTYTHTLSLSLSLCLSFLIALFRTRHTHTHTPAYYARTHRRSSLSRCIWPIHARVFRSQQCGRRGTSVRTRKTSRASGGARLSSVETRSISPREILSAPPPLPHPRAAFPLAGRRIATRGSSLLDLTYDRSRGLSTFGQRRAVRGRRTPVLDLPRANRQSRNG